MPDLENDIESFNEITTAKPEAITQAVETPAAAVVDAKPAPTQPEADPRVPLHELIAERKARQEAQAEIALFRREREEAKRNAEPPKKVDLFENPDGFVDQRMESHLQQVQATAMYNAKLIAEARFGEDKINAAQQHFDALATAGQLHPAVIARVMNSPNPFAEAAKWHKEYLVQTTVGDDLEAYRTKLRAELLADPEFRKEADAAWRQQAAGTPGQIRPAIPSTPSLGRVGASALAAASVDDMSDEELFKSTVSRKRSK